MNLQTSKPIHTNMIYNFNFIIKEILISFQKQKNTSIKSQADQSSFTLINIMAQIKS